MTWYRFSIALHLSPPCRDLTCAAYALHIRSHPKRAPNLVLPALRHVLSQRLNRLLALRLLKAFVLDFVSEAQVALVRLEGGVLFDNVLGHGLLRVALEQGRGDRSVDLSFDHAPHPHRVRLPAVHQALRALVSDERAARVPHVRARRLHKEVEHGLARRVWLHLIHLVHHLLASDVPTPLLDRHVGLPLLHFECGRPSSPCWRRS